VIPSGCNFTLPVHDAARWRVVFCLIFRVAASVSEWRRIHLAHRSRPPFDQAKNGASKYRAPTAGKRAGGKPYAVRILTPQRILTSMPPPLVRSFSNGPSRVDVADEPAFAKPAVFDADRKPGRMHVAAAGGCVEPEGGTLVDGDPDAAARGA